MVNYAPTVVRDIEVPRLEPRKHAKRADIHIDVIPRKNIRRTGGRGKRKRDDIFKCARTGGYARNTKSREAGDSTFPEEIHCYRSKMHANIVLRSKVIASIRHRMVELGFTEFQTPTLTASSPEGARDYLVPSRRHPGKFYALPQAPQMFKQIIMVSGFDRYFQIAPCYRDEDSRADRSPGEFYQLDLEMSFVTQDDVFKAVESLLVGVFTEFSTGRAITQAPFPHLTFDDAMLRFGTDKPDLRNPLEIREMSDAFATSGFKAFAGKTVRALRVPAGGGQTRSFWDRLEERAKNDGAAGLAWLLVEPDLSFKGPIAKFLDAATAETLRSRTESTPGDAVILIADSDKAKVCRIMSGLRIHLGDTLGLLEQNVYKFCWIVDFPMYEFDAEANKIEFSHNPFSMPQGGLDALNNKDPLTIKAFQYDIVCNGIELSSGAIRNHHPEIMYRAFEIAGYERSEVDSRFRALINALKFGAPPPWRHRARRGSHYHAARRRTEYPRDHHVPHESERGRSDDERAQHGAAGAAPRSPHQGRREAAGRQQSGAHEVTPFASASRTSCARPATNSGCVPAVPARTNSIPSAFACSAAS